MKKLLNKKGFTLMEMLIVVAIIVILVAVSVPTFTASLNDAKSATDKANERAAKAAAVAYVMDPTNNVSADIELYYNADTGKISSSATGITAYGAVSKGHVIVSYDKDDDTYTISWSGDED